MSEGIKLIVLAGGLGTRIRTSIGDKPKALAPVADRTFIELLVEDWKKKGIEEFIFLLGFKGIEVENILTKSPKLKNLDISMQFIHEDKLLGTGGAIINAISKQDLNGDFLVINSDTWISSSHKNLVRAKSPCIGIIKVEDTSRFGEVLLEEDIIKDFLEKNPSQNSGYINSGLYLLNNKIFDQWPLGKAFSMERDLFPEFIKEGILTACKMEGNFIDIGIPEDYNYFLSNLEEFVTQ